MLVLPKGMRHIPGYLDRAAQEHLVDEIRAVAVQAPLYRPEMPRTGKPLSVRMTNCGELGWVADKTGYRYQDRHPVTGATWPPIPESLMKIWMELSGDTRPPQACLVNFYDASARMGLHQDRDEQDFSAPVLSVSLGDACLFRVGGTARNEPTRSFRLESGDIVVLGGDSRLAFHGVDRIYPTTSTLLKDGGRINLTLRRVSA
ncbi:alpha-ketoglutarate-dependent dioxygenase AlkB [Hoeflea sp.]|uniref:alpha-ketoglutarate-dependent dioxygenase AlkB family protein n=1 Tax=Hoeflea sp. TaxID=1940281 RepID=UPI001999A858|nr:alpha-ketoglutarate-dependent dioxygenase AlkB [Hoeflea sp.]MBC7280294.1 alpha-ketoglutarate-dependent dioxygenase AlkB [Hoeflea sp.]